MKKKMKVAEAIATFKALGDLKRQTMPVQLAWDMRANFKAFQEQIVIFEDIRKEKMEEYAVKDENGRPILVDGRNFDLGENRDKAMLELQELASKEIEVDITQIDIREFKSGIPNISIETLEFLEPILVERKELKQIQPKAKRAR